MVNPYHIITRHKLYGKVLFWLLTQLRCNADTHLTECGLCECPAEKHLETFKEVLVHSSLLVWAVILVALQHFRAKQHSDVKS
ncbi:hypothetical protein XELAEV_18000379mg [Xenopus laevis]|uniref:Uncharacterized protein n=1 Tax=Xenopus laevis TaxID=8355 RepID=A0A974GYL1_XENLA|nr:hypothetical protein XELAEV_18000379mg [Xenopus laevis]